MQKLIFGQATSSRPDIAAPRGPLVVTVRQEEPFQASARFMAGPCVPAQCSPTNRHLTGDAQETSLAKTSTPRAGLGTASASQLPPLSISDRPGEWPLRLKAPTAMQNVRLGHESPFR